MLMMTFVGTSSFTLSGNWTVDILSTDCDNRDPIICWSATNIGTALVWGWPENRGE